LSRLVAGHLRRGGGSRRVRGLNLVWAKPVRQIWLDHDLTSLQIVNNPVAAV